MYKNKEFVQNTEDHIVYMQRCLELGAKGIGSAAPNPMVGSVIVCEGRIIGEGYHTHYGHAHAEVNAINSVADKEKLKRSTLYVNLEPCAHQGKTPPCTDLIIQSEIPRVIIGSIDSNSLVAGRGIRKLREAGVQVTTNILEKESFELNRRFFTFHKYKRPYIILKWAQSADGFLDVNRNSDSPVGINWISNSLSRKLVHKWRSEEQAIMVGTNTIITDNPELNTRFWPGSSPIRVVVDKNLRISQDKRIYNGSSETMIFNSRIDKEENNIRFIKIEFNDDSLEIILQFLHCNNILSAIIEGGSLLLNSFLEKEIWDEARVFTGRKKFRKGIYAPRLNLFPESIVSLLGDDLSLYRNSSFY